MAKVPYLGIPEVEPRQTPTPYFELDRAASAAGAAAASVGHAVANIGEQITKVGDVLDKHRLKMLEDNNTAVATDLSVKFDTDIAKLDSDFSERRGMDAANSLNEYSKKSEEIRMRYRGSAPNDAVRKQFDIYSRRSAAASQKTIIGHAARERKQFISNQADSKVAMGLKQIANGADTGDENELAVGLQTIKEATVDQMRVRGIPLDSDHAKNALELNTSSGYKTWIQSRLRRDVNSARELYDRYYGHLTAADRETLHKEILTGEKESDAPAQGRDIFHNFRSPAPGQRSEAEPRATPTAFVSAPSVQAQKIAWAESSGNPNAQASNTSAGGLAGFTDETWLETVALAKPSLLVGRSEEQVLALKKEPEIAMEMLRAKIDMNQKVLWRNKLPITDATTYLAHFLGPTGAVKLLKAPPDALASNHIGKESVAKNRKVIEGKTVADMVAWASGKMAENPEISNTKLSDVDPTPMNPAAAQTWAGMSTSMNALVSPSDAIFDPYNTDGAMIFDISAQSRALNDAQDNQPVDLPESSLPAMYEEARRRAQAKYPNDPRSQEQWFKSAVAGIDAEFARSKRVYIDTRNRRLDFITKEIENGKLETYEQLSPASKSIFNADDFAGQDRIKINGLLKQNAAKDRPISVEEMQFVSDLKGKVLNEEEEKRKFLNETNIPTMTLPDGVTPLSRAAKRELFAFKNQQVKEQAGEIGWGRAKEAMNSIAFAIPLSPTQDRDGYNLFTGLFRTMWLDETKKKGKALTREENVSLARELAGTIKGTGYLPGIFDFSQRELFRIPESFWKENYSKALSAEGGNKEKAATLVYRFWLEQNRGNVEPFKGGQFNPGGIFGD